MVKTIHTMYALAQREAVCKGPRKLDINGGEKVAYYLSKAELRKLFRTNGYNVNGVTWLKYVIGWKEDWEELAPSNSTILNPSEDWNLVFVHPCKTDLTALKMCAEDLRIPALAVEQ